MCNRGLRGAACPAEQLASSKGKHVLRQFLPEELRYNPITHEAVSAVQWKVNRLTIVQLGNWQRYCCFDWAALQVEIFVNKGGNVQKCEPSAWCSVLVS